MWNTLTTKFKCLSTLICAHFSTFYLYVLRFKVQGWKISTLTFSLTLISMQFLQLNEAIGSLVMLAAIYILFRINVYSKVNFVLKLITNITGSQSGTKVRAFLLQLLQTQHLLKGQDFIETDWLRDVLQKLWLSHLIKSIQEQLDRRTNNEFVSSDGTVIRFEKFVLKKEIAPVFKDIVPEESFRNDSVTLRTRVIFLGSVYLLDTRKDSKIVLKDISFRGMARIVFRPFSDCFPFVSGLVFHLISNPLIDSVLNLKYIFESGVSFEEIQNFNEFIVNECSLGYVYPNLICVRLTDDISVNHAIRFPDAFVLCSIQIIAAEDLPKPSKDAAASNLYCCLSVGKETFKAVAKSKTTCPRFDLLRFVAINDAYECCSIKIFDKQSSGSEVLIGEVKFSMAARLFAFAKDKGKDKLNGVDIWMPLEKNTQGSVHFRFATFDLDDNFNILYNTVNAMQSLPDNWRKIPLSVFSIFIGDLQLSSFETKEISEKSKDKKIAKLVIIFNEKKFETGEEKLVNGKFSWNAGFHLLNEDMEHKGTIEFLLIEVTANKSKVVATARLNAKDIIEDRLNMEKKKNKEVKVDGIRKVVFRKKQNERMHALIDFAIAEVHLSVKIVKLDMTTLTKFADSLKRSDGVHTVAPYRNMTIPILINSHVEEKVDYKEKVDNNIEKPVPQEVTQKEITENECAVKLQLSFINKSTLCVHVICAKNLPVFDDGENPNPAIIVELWKNNVKVTQKSTKFSRRTRDPFYGRKLLFYVTEDSPGKYILRILVASRIGLFRKKIVLIAEMYKQLPMLDSVGEKDWYKLNVIRVNDSTGQKTKMHK